MTSGLVVRCLTVDEVACYVGTSLASTARSDLTDHVDRCESCRATVAAAMRAARTTDPPPDDTLVTGTRVGRYVVSSLLGVGGLGRVYAAYDPELDRRIALKLVRDPDLASAEALARLTREAQLTARLSHPNVVAVYDVGSFDAQVFVAMELVDGTTLRAWLEAESRDWRSVLAMFRQAGEGLAAAHAAGLIHRDVKPDNVLVGNDGRARVGDFGLARLVDMRASDAATDDVPPQRVAPATPGGAITRAGDAANGDAPPQRVAPAKPGLAITRAGAVLGTPAYMALEQLRGCAADARSDQFSFCVSLYEGLYGERPFAGPTIADLVRAIEAGELRPPRGAVPAWLRAIVVRGLAVDPAARHASLADLLAALAVDPRIRRRRIASGAVVVAVIAGGFAWTSTRGSEPTPCRSSPSDFGDAWNPTRRQALEAAFRASHRPFAELAITRVESVIDRYADRWRELHVDACEATHVRHEQSSELLDRRNACLEERRAAVAQQVTLFGSADAPLVDRAVRLANELPELAACSDRAALLAVVPLPPEPLRRAQVQPLRGQIAAAEVLQRNARYPETQAAITTLRPIVDALAYPPLAAMLDELAGATAEDLHDTNRAIAAFDRSALEAETGGDDVAKARALIGGARVRGIANVEPELTTKLFDQAKATLARVGGAPDLAVRLELAIGAIAVIRGDFASVVPHDRAAVALAEKAYGADDVRTATARGDLAEALERTGAYDEAATLAAAAIGVFDKQLGPSHPRTTRVRATWGQILFDQAKYDDAMAQQQLVLDATRSVFGDASPDLWGPLSDLARSHEGKAEFGDALALYERAKPIVDRAFGPNHPNSVLIRVNVASALLELKRSDEAVVAFRDAIARSIVAVGRDNIFAANCQNGIAQAWRASHPVEALAAAQEALRLFRTLQGEEHPDTGRGYDTLGRVLEVLGRRAEAIAALERALAIREKALGADHPDTADSRFALATVLDAAGQHSRAVELATAAARAFRASGDTATAGEIEVWLKRRQRTR